MTCNKICSDKAIEEVNRSYTHNQRNDALHFSPKESTSRS